MIRLPPMRTWTATLVPYTPLFRSVVRAQPQFGATHPCGRQPVADGAGRLRVAQRSIGGLAQWHRVGARPDFGTAEFRRQLADPPTRSEEHTSELQSLMRISYAVFCLTKKNYIELPI